MATERTRAYFDQESAGIYVTGYKPTQANYTDWIYSTLWKEDYDAANGVPQLNSSSKLAVSKLYPGASPTNGHVIKYNSTSGVFEVGAVTSNVTIDIGGSDQTNKLTELGDSYNISHLEGSATGFYAPYLRKRYKVKSATYTITLGDSGSIIVCTGTGTYTMPTIDTDLYGLPFMVVSLSGTITLNAGSGQTFPGYSATLCTGVEELSSNSGTFELTNGKFVEFAMPTSGTVWDVVHKGDWGSPIPKTVTVSPSGSTITVDGSKYTSYVTSTLADGNYTLSVSNMRDTGVMTIAKISSTSSGKITTWPSNTYFSGNVANAAAVTWTTHDLITIEKKGSSYYVDVVEQSLIS